METVLVRSIYMVDTISKGNAKAWAKLMEYMEGKDYDVLFDFKGIEVVQPWATPEFAKFMQNERVHLKLWCSENTVNTINIMCTLNGVSNDRAINEDIIPERVPTKEEIQIEKMAGQLQQYFEETPDGAVFNIYKRFDQIGVPITVSYAEAAMVKYAEEHGVTKIHLEARNIVVQSSVIENVTGLIKKMEGVGVELTINSNDPEVMNKVGMYKSLSTNRVYSDQDKIRLIKATLNPGKVGMLIKYRDSKATDEFGRSGKGKPVSCRVAIYLGMKKAKDTLCLCFRTYNGNTFYTHVHWSLEHDNEVLDKLDSDDLAIPVSQFGMYNDFLGSKYHLITPVQYNENDSMVMYGLDDAGKVTHPRLTIPERIKAVFDDWNVSYDTESLRSYIQKTKEVLENA